MNPGTLVCVDEARIPAKDKSCPFLTYNPNKPHKWALESLTLTLSNKYLWDFTNPAEQDNPTPFQWLIQCGEKLRSSFPRRIFHITADTRFSSVEQAEQLQKIGVYCTLACKKNSPTEIWDKALGADLQKWRVHMAIKANTRRPLLCASYHQKRVLNLVSFWFDARKKEEATRDDRLPLLNHYDDTKRWTDQHDQLAAAYHFKHKHQNYMTTLLVGWFIWARTNAYIIYDMLHPGELTHMKFISEVGSSYLKYPLGEVMGEEVA
jgi:hypothetical protein